MQLPTQRQQMKSIKKVGHRPETPTIHAKRMNMVTPRKCWLLLHCVREFRGDEKIREYVWALITPSHRTQKNR
ncbi:hypothetical protein niasHT_028972 [Heterodera trifolii]|uniref:Uncharacterized protein n=1 Tax=Heterodera trifolii TaxID=157864 RepID=A0ABD2JAL5_9BILA